MIFVDERKGGGVNEGDRKCQRFPHSASTLHPPLQWLRRGWFPVHWRTVQGGG